MKKFIFSLFLLSILSGGLGYVILFEGKFENFEIGGIDKLGTVPLFPSALIKNIERILLNYILRRQMQ